MTAFHIDISEGDRSTLDSDFIPTASADSSHSSMDGFDDDDNWVFEVDDQFQEREVEVARSVRGTRSVRSRGSARGRASVRGTVSAETGGRCTRGRGRGRESETARGGQGDAAERGGGLYWGLWCTS